MLGSWDSVGKGESLSWKCLGERQINSLWNRKDIELRLNGNSSLKEMIAVLTSQRWAKVNQVKEWETVADGGYTLGMRTEEENVW